MIKKLNFTKNIAKIGKKIGKKLIDLKDYLHN